MKVLGFIPGLLILISCSRQEITPIYSKISREAYYTKEIFDSAHLKIYGSWNFKLITCGWSGKGQPEFSHLEIARFGIYSVTNTDDILEYGKINIISQNDSSFTLEFIKKFGQNDYLNNRSLEITFNGDSMIFWDRMADGCFRTFKRIQ